MYFIDKGDLERVTPPASGTLLTLPTSASPSYFYEVLWLVKDESSLPTEGLL